ncbi:MAG: uncharacterized protein A8A55_0808 [Amphiamblys sp. WSBS2006]|nr:MAG: uncharacterized protein A8A55_0808 [Amphiamblys sp. WSBS2006]
MKIFSVSLAKLSVCVGALSSFIYVPRDVLPRFQTEQERSIYFLNEGEQPITLCSVYFRYDSRDKRVPSPVSLLRFVYDETEAKTRYTDARDITEEVARLIADHAEVDTERRLFFVSFADDVSSVQAVPKGIAEVSVLRTKESKIEYFYKKEKEHGNIFDSFLIAEEFKRGDNKKTPIIKNMPEKRKEAVLLLSFLAEKEFQFDLKTISDIQREEYKWGLKLSHGVSLFVSEESSCNLEVFDLTGTKIKKLSVFSFDITSMNLKNTHIEEMALVDDAALEFFYDSIERTEFYVEKVSFGNKLNPQSERFLKLIERVHEGETTAPKKIKALFLSRNCFFGFLEEASRTAQKEIHVEDLGITQSGKDTGPEIGTSTRIIVSKKISIKGNPRVLLFIEFGPELSHFNIDELQRQCRSPEIYIPRINIRLTENKIIVREKMLVLQFLKKNITATEVGFFADKGKKAFRTTKITLVSGEMENICFWEKGLSVLPIITNKKINVRQMEVMDIVGFSDQEKEETKKKEFVIREKLYMRNTGIIFLELLGNTIFIPVIEIEINRCMENWGGFGEKTGTHIKTNALVENINKEIGNTREIKQTIGEMITQKEAVVKKEFGYQKLVFEEDSKYGEQRETGESSEELGTEYQVFEEFKEYYSLLEGSLDGYIPDDLFFPEEDWYLKYEEVSLDDTCWNHLFEGRG